MLPRRIFVLIVLLVGLGALAVLLAPPPPQQTVAPAPVAPPPPPPKLTPEPTANINITDDPGIRPVTVKAKVGETVTISVTGSVTDIVAIEDLGLKEVVAPTTPAQLQFYADTTGTYPITLLENDRQIGQVVVSSPKT